MIVVNGVLKMKIGVVLLVKLVTINLLKVLPEPLLLMVVFLKLVYSLLCQQPTLKLHTQISQMKVLMLVVANGT
jgi:hypothetical protein